MERADPHCKTRLGVESIFDLGISLRRRYQVLDCGSRIGNGHANCADELLGGGDSDHDSDGGVG